MEHLIFNNKYLSFWGYGIGENILLYQSYYIINKKHGRVDIIYYVDHMRN